MGSWYWIGVSVGIASAVGVACAGIVAPRGRDLIAVPIAAGGLGELAGVLVQHWQVGGLGDQLGGIAGGLVASLGAAVIVAGALRRGGTRGGVAILVAGAALVLAGLAFVPAAGFLEAVVIPALALRLRRTQPERYAGLRTLAKD